VKRFWILVILSALLTAGCTPPPAAMVNLNPTMGAQSTTTDAWSTTTDAWSMTTDAWDMTTDAWSTTTDAWGVTAGDDVMFTSDSPTTPAFP
jgi:hypothetical protein